MKYASLVGSVREGDLIYGLATPLLEALSSVDVLRRKAVRRLYFGLFPGRAVEKATAILQADLTDSVWDRDKPTEYSSNQRIKGRLVNAARGQSFRNFLASHERYNVAEQYTNLYFDSGNNAHVRRAWGRTSKAGLEFQLGRGWRVHFILTGIVLHDVASKTGTGGPGFVTAKELRWLYRHRNVAQVQNHLHFWKDDREVPHSEMWADPAWAAYQPTKTPIDLKRTEPPRLSLNLGAPFKVDF